MKILFLVTSADIGGAQRNVLFNAKKLKKEGKEVLVGAGKAGWLSKEIEKVGVPFFLFKNFKRSLNPIWSLFFIFELRKFVKRNNITVINFNGSNSLLSVFGLWGFKSKPKTIFTVHGLSYLSPGFKKSKIVKILVWLSMKITIPFMDEIIFVCNYDLETAQKLHLIKIGQGRVVYNEIEPINFLNREEAINELKKIKNFPDNKIIIGTITRLEYAKNNEFLIKAISELSKEISDKIICIIIGDGPERKNYELLITNYELRDEVFLLGDISNASRYLKAFDI
ncbi:MAG: glycosyltransferase, group 1 family, partial [Parcubacteria group bacterium Athens0714_24]